MSLISHIKCDACTQEIFDDALPHETRQEYTRRPDKDTEVVLERRDLCDACALRIKQVIMSELHNCAWILDGFEVKRK